MSEESLMQWYDDLEAGPEYEAEKLKLDFAYKIDRMMNAGNMSKADLAKRMGKTPAYITKVLRGDANVTLDTIAKLAHYVDGEVHIHVAPSDMEIRWFEVTNNIQNDRRTKDARCWARTRQRVGVGN